MMLTPIFLTFVDGVVDLIEELRRKAFKSRRHPET